MIKKSSPNHQIWFFQLFVAGNPENWKKPREVFKKYQKHYQKAITKSSNLQIFNFLWQKIKKIEKNLEKCQKIITKIIKFCKFSFFSGNPRKNKKKREIFKKLSKTLSPKSSPSHPTRGIARTTKIHEIECFCCFSQINKNWKKPRVFFKKISKNYQNIFKILSKYYQKIIKKSSKNYQKIITKIITPQPCHPQVFPLVHQFSCKFEVF